MATSSAPSVKTLAQNLWIKAWTSPEPLRFDCGTEKERHRMAFTLYNAVKAIRKADRDDPRVSKQLWDAVQNVTIRQDGTVLTMMRQTDTKLGRMMQEALGADAGAELLSAEDQAAAEAEKRLRERLDLPGPGAPAATAVRKTPYYTREG